MDECGTGLWLIQPLLTPDEVLEVKQEPWGRGSYNPLCSPGLGEDTLSAVMHSS